jgi:hypothetical protein
MVVATGALLELEDERTDLTEGGVRVQAIDGDPDRLAVLARLYAQLESGERLVADRYAMGIGMHRTGPASIWKQYVGPPPLPSDPVEQERFLAQYRVRRRDVEDALDQMLGRDPEQHRPPRLSWETLIDRLAEAGIEVTEQQLIGLPFRCEFSAPLRAELAA